MDRATYLKIRANHDLEKKSGPIAVFIALNTLLMLSVYVCWSFFEDSSIRYCAGAFLFVAMFRSFGIMHDAVHKTVSRRKRLNDFIGIVGGSLCMLPFETWKSSHMKHHQWSGNVEKDPVMALIVVYPKMPRHLQNFISGSWRVWFPLLGFLQHVVFWNLSFKLYRQEPKSAKILISLLSPFIVWGSLLTLTSASFIVGVVVPAVFIYFVAIEVVNFPHHLQLPQHRGEEKFLAWQQYHTARSCMYPTWFARFVVLNFNYHIEHHMFPDVPWYHLDKIHKDVREALKDEYNTDPHFSWILENRIKSVGEVLSPVGNPAEADKDKKIASAA